MQGFRRSAVNTFFALLAALTAALVLAASALAAADITVTFVRHAESQANADGIINTQVPGPNITDPIGKGQAEAIATVLAGNGYDGIYASDMVRTQQTAAPLAGLLQKTPAILPGLHEIDAGIFEGSSEDSGLGRLGYGLVPALWMLGARFVPMPGSSDSDGNAFEARVNGALQTIYDSGHTNSVAFSHGATIMFWTMMNVDNPDLGLLFTHQLDNTGVVVIKGNPDDGWTLVSWDGVAVDADPSFGTKLFVNVRDLIVAPQDAAYAVSQALANGNLIDVASAFVKAVAQVAWAPVKFVVSVVGDVIHEVFKPKATQNVSTDTLRTAAVADSVPEPTALPSVAPETVAADHAVVRPVPAGDRAPLTLVKSGATEPVQSAGESGDAPAEAPEVVKDEQSDVDAGNDATPATTGATDTDEAGQSDQDTKKEAAEAADDYTKADVKADVKADDVKTDTPKVGDQAPAASDPTDNSPAADTSTDHAAAA